ncbi:Acyl-CoA N-acyltransferases superfamily protein [Quillaja saponaria]|uniref:Acyl-CoA N-acyltransferases superfamily protein n=1 Tax=Quillaja saponaria TaxID=32244 RepID=A0AAD7PHQ7_QUISA|nr:Acyl-CoA N-acyltransferases superfamily protein [Quillaja saponaria]
MVDSILDRVSIREFDMNRDTEVVGKLERNCEIGTKKGVSIFSNMMGDPFSRIRFYPLHVMLVAELLESGELVGVVRGCIKTVGTATGGTLVKMGCILGLRVSPAYRRMGIGLKLVNLVEEWMLKHGAQYTFLATEKNNNASMNLFTVKCNYMNLSSLIIFIQPTGLPRKNISKDIKIDKLRIDQAISLYKSKLRGKDLYPLDIDMILKEKLSLGTWISYFKDESRMNLNNRENNEDFSDTPSSWVIFSIWNTCKTYELQIKKSQPLKFFHTTLCNAREKIFPCLRMPVSDSLSRPFGFLFLYGLHGEGENLGELMESIWSFTSQLGESMKDCKVVITELGLTDPLTKHVPQNSSISRIDDIWYVKNIIGHIHGKDESLKGPAGNVFVDPRDF